MALHTGRKATSQKVKIITLLFLTTAGQSALLAQSDLCKDVLDVAYNRLATTNNSSIASAAREWFCSSRFTSDVARFSASGKITVPIEGIPIEFGGGADDASTRTTRDEFCRDASSQFSSSDANTLVSQVLNPEAVQAWIQCYAIRSRVTGVQLDPTVSGREIVVKAHYQIRTNTARNLLPQIVDFIVTGADAQQGQWTRGADVGPGGIAHVFRRHSEDTPVTITLMTTEGVTETLTIPARSFPAVVGEIRVAWTESYREEVKWGIWTRNITTGDHHCESRCRDEPTRTTYELDIEETEPGFWLANPRLVCISGICGSHWNLNRVELIGTRRAYASWDVLSRPTAFRLEVDRMMYRQRQRNRSSSAVRLQRGQRVVIRVPIEGRGWRLVGRTLAGEFDMAMSSGSRTSWFRYGGYARCGEEDCVYIDVFSTPQ